MSKTFLYEAKDWYRSNYSVYMLSRRASTGLRMDDLESFHYWMFLVSLCEYNYYKSKRAWRRRALEAWKNYVFHLRSFNEAQYFA